MLKSRVGEGWSAQGEKPRNLAATCRMLTDFIDFFDEKKPACTTDPIPNLEPSRQPLFALQFIFADGVSLNCQLICTATPCNWSCCRCNELHRGETKMGKGMVGVGSGCRIPLEGKQAQFLFYRQGTKTQRDLARSHSSSCIASLGSSSQDKNW